MAITVGTQVCFDGDPADTGTVCEIEEVDRRSSGRMGGQGGGQFLGSTKTLRYRVTWDNGTCTGEWYRESELTVIEPVPASSTALDEVVDQVDEATQAVTGRAVDCVKALVEYGRN